MSPFGTEDLLETREELQSSVDEIDPTIHVVGKKNGTILVRKIGKESDIVGVSRNQFKQWLEKREISL